MLNIRKQWYKKFETYRHRQRSPDNYDCNYWQNRWNRKNWHSVDKRMKQMEESSNRLTDGTDSNTTKIGEVQTKELKPRQIISQIQDKLNKLRQKKEEIEIEIRKESHSRELYSKQFNYLIHGIPESSDNLWKTLQQTKKLFRKLAAEGLKSVDNYCIKVTNIHRLPQHPTYDSDKRKIKPSDNSQIHGYFRQTKFC